ncbi:uncharacterized protein LOC117108907 [Anneissia japonica]|uniref:uncharacterized protein LOC117108907 n=1 Tax=Anneissia japonica TaxID=1529436 RepID=UPI001425595B|nr:uncharacterized protein LOC117108907 [Anneissia japonica]
MTSPGERTFSTFGKKAGSQLKAASDALYGPKKAQGPMLPSGEPSRPVLGPTLPTKGLSRPVQGPTLPPTFLQAQKEEDKEDERKRMKYERKKYQKHNDMVMEELVPRATGHEGKIEKRIGRADAKRARQTSPDLHDSMLMGTSSDNFQARMAARKRNREAQQLKNTVAAKQKLQDYQEKEQAKMKALLEMARATKSENAMW